MKKFLWTIALAGLFIGCAKEYDDSELTARVDTLEQEVSAVKALVNSLNEQVTGMQAVINQWKQGGFVESIQDVKDDAGNVVGYTIKFVGGQTVTINNGKDGTNGTDGKDGKDGKDGTNGKDGKDGTNGTNGTNGTDGKTPGIVIVDGNAVWAIDGEPILVGGKMVPANVIPSFEINADGHLIMTLSGETIDLGKVVGEGGGEPADSLIDEIVKGEDSVVFKLHDGSSFEIPFAKAFKLVFEAAVIDANAGETLKVPYTITNGTEDTVVDCFAGGSYLAEVDAEAKEVVVTVPDPFVPGQVLVWATNEKGLTSMVKLSFDAAPEVVIVTPSGEFQNYPAEGGEFVVDITSNVDIVVEEPSVDWVTAVVTKADYKLTLTVQENTTDQARVTGIHILRKSNGQIVQSIVIGQLPAKQTIVKDVINNAFTGVEGTDYADWTATGTSGVVYSGQTAGDAATVQMRSDPTKAAAGIVTTTTVGTVTKVAVKWNEKTSNNRFVDVFGSNVPYESIADQNDPDKRGYYLGSIDRLDKTKDVAGELELDGNFAYIMLRSADSALYLDEITITWDKEGTPQDPKIASSYEWDFASDEWQAKFAEKAAAGVDAYAWKINYDGLWLVSHNKSKYNSTNFQWGGKGSNRDRFIDFIAPTDGYVLVNVSNTASSADMGRTVRVENAGTSVEQNGGFACDDPQNLIYEVKAGHVIISAPVNGLRFYKVLFSETDPTPKEMVLERVWGFYKDGTTPWYATSNITAVAIANPDGYGMARGLAMDDEYIYLPKASAYANVCAVSIADKSVQKALNKSGVSGGSTFATSFVRMIKNTDPAVNGGKDVLLLCNLTATDSDANQLKLYAYKDGVDAAPTKIAAFCWDSANSTNDWRRYGDRFFVDGDWSKAKVYFPSFNANKTVCLQIENGARTAVIQIAAGAANSPDGIKDLTVYPGDNKLFLTNGSIANLVSPTGGKANGWDEYTLVSSASKGINTWGYNFFEFNGKKYIAYARIIGETKAQIEIVEDKGDLLTSITAQEGLMVSPIHDATDLDKEVATGNLADCCVRVIGDEVYIAALTRDGGFVLDKLYLK